MSAADLAGPLREAILGASDLAAYIPEYKDTRAIFTRRPAPNDAEYPMVMISPDISVDNQDGLNDFRPIQQRDVTAYGKNDTAQNYRNVEALAYGIHELFHAKRLSIIVPGWNVIQITARGPIPAPTDDDATIARMVMLTIQLAKPAA